jgi:hypothetical protein|tara:strand:- start:316 stop:1191 length:876 start_codon:yes stop_codon:yes gene_type:complete
MIRRLLNFFNFKKKNINSELQDLKLSIGQIQSKLNTSSLEKNIKKKEFKVFSQWGEDGIIDYLISNLDIENKTFIEFGVENYSEANTKFLLLNRNWSGFVIDSSYENVQNIKKNELYWKYSLTAKSEFITKENVNSVLGESNFDKNLGLLSIDVDGNDYWIWEQIKDIDPSIVVIEYNSRFGKEKSYVVPYEKNFQRLKKHYSGIYYGASLKALIKLAIKKGYSFITCNSAGNNAFFVKKDLLNDKVKENNLEKGFVINKFRESRTKEGNLAYLSKIEEQKIIFSLPLTEV